MKTVFISYRRADSSGYTRSLYSDLIREFSAQQIFMDVDDIPAGADFVVEINNKLKGAHILIVMMGKKWLEITNSNGQRRLDNPNDFVRIEIEYAIKKGIKIFPILLENAVMPNEIDLPELLKPLARKQALFLSNKDYKYHVEKIIASVVSIISPDKVHSTQKKNNTPASATKKTFIGTDWENFYVDWYFCQCVDTVSGVFRRGYTTCFF